MSERSPIPLAEFDPARDAFINPSHIARDEEMPDACVLTWFRDAALRLVDERGGFLISENNWEDGPHPFYEIEHQGRRLAIVPCPVGAATAVGQLELAIAMGSRAFVACGGAGSLRQDVTLGHLVVVTSALRDEGTSFHYAPPSRTIDADPRGVRAITETLDAHGVPYATGRTWTTDAFYRETHAKIADRRGEGCLTVEMEASALAAVARFRGVPLGQVLYGGDDLTGTEWDHRDWQSQAHVRDNLLSLAADAALRLADSTASPA